MIANPLERSKMKRRITNPPKRNTPKRGTKPGPAYFADRFSMNPSSMGYGCQRPL